MPLSRKTLVFIGAGLAMTSSSANALGEGLGKAGAGLQQMADGIQTIGQHAASTLDAVEARKEKFVDVAGNVYEVLTDSLGQATKFVVDSTGAILDSTKIAGGFVLDTLVGYPQDVREGIDERYVVVPWVLWGFVFELSPWSQSGCTHTHSSRARTCTSAASLPGSMRRPGSRRCRSLVRLPWMPVQSCRSSSRCSTREPGRTPRCRADRSLPPRSDRWRASCSACTRISRTSSARPQSS